MKRNLSRGLTFFIVILLAFHTGGLPTIQAQSLDPWWDQDWPYRVAVQVNEPGPTGINLNFTQLFSELGLVGGLLDLQSIRVIPMESGTPGGPVPYQETYSTAFFDGEVLNTDSSSGEPYWHAEYQIEQALDELKYTEGSHSLKTTIDVQSVHNSLSDFIYYFNGNPISNWSQYEFFTYDLWPEVNQSALDQSPDLFQFELLGLENCFINKVNSPALALNQWNSVTISLAPYGTCVAPDSSSLTGLRFSFPLNMIEDGQNNFDIGDQVTLWLDNFRLVDQDGEGEIRWNAAPGIDTYYIYFDTLNRAGHPKPALSETPITEPVAATPDGPPESGGYFHQIAGTITAGLSIWTAPITEKIFKGQSAPVSQNSLEFSAAKGEYEALQLVVNSAAEQSLPVSVSDLILEEVVLPASAIEIFRVDYVQVTRLSDEYGRLTDWPDPLYPISAGQQVTFPAGENQPLWFRVKIPEDAPAGQYTGQISIGAAVIPFTLTVWDFNLFTEHLTLPFYAGLDLETVLETYRGTIDGEIQPCYDNLVNAINETLNTYYITPLPPDIEPSPGLIYTLTNFPQAEAHEAQLQSGEIIWWTFTEHDRSPFANPAIIDHPGQDSRILPWMAWVDRVDGIFYHQLTDWDINPWEEPGTDSPANGDGFLFYPPKDDSIGYDPCDPASNRLIPSIRLELLREGLEDYAYLRLLNGKPGDSDQTNPSDLLTAQILSSRTLYQHSPTRFNALRAEIANRIIAKQADTYLPMFTH